MTDEQKPQMIVFPDEQSAEKESKERLDSVLSTTEEKTKEALDKTIDQICSGEISPEVYQRMKRSISFDPYSFIEGKKLIPTQIASFTSMTFVAFLELAGTIYAGLDWNKKGRIVVEYDPQSKKFTVATFQEAKGLNIDPDHEEVPRFLLHPEGR